MIKPIVTVCVTSLLLLVLSYPAAGQAQWRGPVDGGPLHPAGMPIAPDNLPANNSTNSAEPPGRNELQEIPAKYCGMFYLIGKDADDSGVVEHFALAKAFGKIGATQVTLAGGEILKVKRITQVERSQTKGILIWFEKTDFAWGITELPDSTLSIMQIDVHLKKRTTTFIVSQNNPPQ